MIDNDVPLPWPFQEPKTLAIFTTRSIVHGGKPVLFVSHDEKGDWQFHDGTLPQVEDAMVVSLYSIVRQDPSIAALADLPQSWQAERDAASSTWRLARTMR